MLRTPKITPLAQTFLMGFISILVCKIHFKLKFVRDRTLNFCLQFFPSLIIPYLYRCHNIPVLMSKKREKREKEGEKEERKRKERKGKETKHHRWFLMTLPFPSSSPATTTWSKSSPSPTSITPTVL